jgi:hypothetical protein
MPRANVRLATRPPSGHAPPWGNGNDIHQIRENDVLRFLRTHSEEIKLGKVDQAGFLDLGLLRGRELREVISAPKGGEIRNEP